MRHGAVLLLLVLGACSQPRPAVPVSGTPEPPGKDEALVVVFRPSFRNASKNYGVFFGEQFVGFAQPGARFEVRCAAGEHLIYLRGVSDHALRATLEGGRTYYVRVDAEPDWLKLTLKLTPVTDFDGLEALLEDLELREAVEGRAQEYADRHAKSVTERLAYYRTEGREECSVLNPEDGARN